MAVMFNWYTFVPHVSHCGLHVSILLLVTALEYVQTCVISGFRRGVNEALAALGFYVVLVFTSVSGKNYEYESDGLSRNVGNYQSTLHNIPEERRPHVKA
jgi:hypothetical protein